MYTKLRKRKNEKKISALPLKLTFEDPLPVEDGESSFTLVNIRISSADGRLVSIQKTAANSTLKIETLKWKSGVYFVEVMQGDKRKVVKLVKL